jgi:hypothetical protein
MRGLLGVLGGLVAAVAVAMLVSFLGALVLGAPAAVDMSNAASIKETYASLTPAQQFLGVASWALGALVGAYLAKRISGRSWAAWTVAVVISLYQLLSVAVLPMPAVMQVLALALPIAGGFIANRMVPERIEEPGEEPLDGTADGTAADADV